MQRKLNPLDFGILLVMLFKVQLRLLTKTGMDSAFNTSGPLVEQEQRALIHKVVNQDNPLAGTPHKVGNVGPGVPYASGWKHLFGKWFGRDFFNFFNDNINFFIGLLLVLLNVEYTLNQLCIIVDKLGYHGERPHDANVNPHGGLGFQNAAEHGDAVAGESVRQVLLMLSSPVL